MRTDPILEELYQTRAAIMRGANGSIDVLLEQFRQSEQTQRALHPEIKWVDFSQPLRGDGAVPVSHSSL
jgi:hypothetical protein